MGVHASEAGPAVIKSNRCTRTVCVGWIPEERKKREGEKEGEEESEGEWP